MQEGQSGIKQFSTSHEKGTVFAEVGDELLGMVHAEYLSKFRHFNNNFISRANIGSKGAH